MASPILIISLLLTLGFSLATQLCIWREQSEHQKTEGGSAMQVLMGDSRRLFANHFITKADIYLHRGVYPSIFDQARREKVRLGKEQAPSLGLNHEAHEKEDHDHDSGKHAEGEHEAHDAVTGLNGAPRDWIEAFGRNFYPTKHAHLDSPSDQKEVLPWLRLAAELNPNAIDTYTVGAYWLWQRMGKVAEAEQFLREGLRANPGSFEVLFELGKLLEESRKDFVRARNLFTVALAKWQASESGKQYRDEFAYLEIVGHLARIEEAEGRLTEATRYLEMMREVSPVPDEIQKRIDGLKAKRDSGAAIERQEGADTPFAGVTTGLELIK